MVGSLDDGCLLRCCRRFLHYVVLVILVRNLLVICVLRGLGNHTTLRYVVGVCQGRFNAHNRLLDLILVLHSLPDIFSEKVLRCIIHVLRRGVCLLPVIHLIIKAATS